MSWEKVKLSEITEYITDGDHQPAPKSDSGVLFIKIKDIQNNQVSFDNALFVPQEYYDRLPVNRKAVSGDTLYTVVGSYGIPAFVKHNTPFCFERNIALLHPNSMIIPKYLYYAVKNPVFYEYAHNIANGSAQKLIPLSKLGDMEISLPPLDLQQKIVANLSAFDDLIENNRKQIKLLEEAAQRLYKEWFVDLRFPGYENMPIVDGVPEGWHLAKLSDVATVNAQSISKQYSYEFVDYVDLSAVSNGHIEATTRFSIQEAPGRAKRVASDGDIIWGMVRPNLKSYALVLHPTETNIFSTGFAVLSAKKIPFSFLYCHVTTDNFVSYLINCTNGAAYPAVKPIHFEDATLLVPSDDILNQFHRIAEPMYRKIEVLEKQLFQAKEARDRLLPKLMNAEIEV